MNGSFGLLYIADCCLFQLVRARPREVPELDDDAYALLAMIPPV
jgi:hypothetical protein